MAKGRLKGAHTDIEDLVVRGTDRRVAIELGAGELPTPTLIRSIYAASTIEFEVEDPRRRVLKQSLLCEKWDAELDGLHFRYDGTVKKTGDTLGLTLEDRWIATLREMKGPKRARRSEMTRAEFIKARFEEAVPGLKFHCPQLHKKQPVKADTKSKGKKAKEEAEKNSGKGITPSNKLTVAGEDATAEQKEIGDRALRTAAGTPGITQVVEEALMCALMDETFIGKLTGGANVLEAEGSGVGADVADVETEVTNFLTGTGGYGEGGAIGIARKHPEYTPPQIATTAQRNEAFLVGGLSAGEKPYARFTKEAKEWVETFNGGEFAGGSIDVTEPYEYKIGKKEDYWTGCKRLAKEVNWRLFIVFDTGYLMPEPELLQAGVALRIDDEILDDPRSGVENVDFERDSNQPVTEIEVEALIAQWELPPGSVIELADHGPASIGFGEGKRAKSGNEISAAKNLKTGEGAARYIVGEIEVAMTGDPAEMAMIKCHKPTAPLPEPRAQTKSIDVGNTGAAGNATVERMLLEGTKAAELKKPYTWAGEDPFTTGVDCSGGVSFLLRVGGFMQGRTSTIGLATFGEAGEGEFVTVYDHAFTGDPHTEHCAIKVAGVVFESGGGGENENSAGGFGKVDPSEVDDFLKQFEIKRHPAGY